MSVGLAAAQEEVETSPPNLPIELSEIPARAASVSTSLNESAELLKRAELLGEIEQNFTQREIAVARNLVALRSSVAAASSRDALGELEQEWYESERNLKRWDDDLRRVADIIDKELTRLDNSAEVWANTLAEAQAAGVAPELLELTRTTEASINQMRQSLGALQRRAFALQGKVGRTQASVQTALDRISDEETSLLNNLLRRERPPLWSDSVYGASVQAMAGRVGSELSRSWAAIERMVRGELDRLGFQIVLLIVIGLFLGRARTHARQLAEADSLTTSAMKIFERPFSIAALITLVLTPQIYLSTPPAAFDAISLLMLIPILRLVGPLLEAKLRPALYFLAGLYLVDWLRDLLEAAPLVARLIFVIEMLAATVLAVMLVRSKALHRADGQKMQSGVRMALDIALGLTSLAALATVAGFVRLGVLLGTGVLNSAYLAILLLAVARAAEALVALFMRSWLSEHLHLIATRRAAIRKNSARVIRLGSFTIWLFVMLDLFALRDAVIDFVKTIIFAELKAGALAISLGDVLAFGATIVAAVIIARMIIVLLEEDVYPRMQLGRGVGFAISSVIKYALITVGFLLAVGAMGIGMDRITILLGAFGVGLGFGLQTIINNFVSGMILVFERPVQVGDSIEVSGVKGKITRIGIRSSTIRTFDGADVTVPNGTMLSDALTNWTMTDRHRRLEVSVGVAYGTDPDTVIRLLKQALAAQEGLLDQPAPMILFTGFGDSSLDFVVRAWVEDNDIYVTTQSDLALRVNRILADNDIEIPFPQRDLHLRSVPPGDLVPEPLA
ncbi:MAG: mechanosensitive ion channel [Gammaproteobacteria bacterium]|nr:mechanosensitive ion channel [Gammaproteobacteria bacterium]